MSDNLDAPDGYSQIQVIARSERGEILGARDSGGQSVAIRLFPGNGTDGESESFLREARGGVRMQHPHIVRSIATGLHHGRHYLVMERVDGPSLGQHVVERGPLTEVEAVTLLSQIAQALGYAWRVGVAHRDVRPINVLLAPARLGVAEPFCAKLSNFGLSRLRQADDARRSHSRGFVESDDLRGLAETVCWALTPTQLERRGSVYTSAASTLRMERVSGKTMQLLSQMLDEGHQPPPSWSQVVEFARQLPGPRSAPVA
jgi:serine/threonine protein kinase